MMKLAKQYAGDNVFMLGAKAWNKPHKYNKKKIKVKEEKLNEAKTLTLPNGVKAIIDFKGITFKTRTSKPVFLDRDELYKFFKATTKYLRYENIEEEFVINPIKQTQYGLAITSNTSIDSFERYKKTCDFVLLMTTTPGESGGKFNKINFRKIREFRNVYSSKTIHVDGGVNDEIAFILRILGVSSVVSGSYLVNLSLIHI